MTRTLHEDQQTFVIISRSVLVRVRNISDIRCGDNENKHFESHNCHLKSYRLRDNVENYRRARQATDDNMVHAHCMLATYTPSEYVIPIDFPLQQRLHENASVLRYTYIVCLILDLDP